MHLGQVFRRVAGLLGLLLRLICILVHVLLQVHQSLVVVRCRHQEVARLLARCWLDLAIRRQAEVYLLGGVGLGRELVDEQLLGGFAGFELLASHEHLDLECHVFFGVVAADAQVVVAVLLVKGVLHVVVFAAVDLEELVVLGVVGEGGGLLQLLGQDVAADGLGLSGLGLVA